MRRTPRLFPLQRCNIAAGCPGVPAWDVPVSLLISLFASERPCHPERRRRQEPALELFLDTPSSEPQYRAPEVAMEVAIVLIGLFGILLVIGAALGLVAFTRLSKVDQNDLVRIPDLLRRVAELERRLGIGQEAEPVTAEPVPGPVVHPPVPRPPSPVPPRVDLETVIAGRWLNRVGLLLVFLAAFYALKWEFDNNVLGPTGRVALWTLIGAGLVAYGQWLVARGHRYLSEGLTGLGGAVLYLTLYFAWDYYKLFPPVVAFVAMILVTAAMLAIAVGRDSQRVALLGLIGGLAPPLLPRPGPDKPVVLFSHLLLLHPERLLVARAAPLR